MVDTLHDPAAQILLAGHVHEREYAPQARRVVLQFRPHQAHAPRRAADPLEVEQQHPVVARRHDPVDDLGRCIEHLQRCVALEHVQERSPDRRVSSRLLDGRAEDHVIDHDLDRPRHDRHRHRDGEEHEQVLPHETTHEMPGEEHAPCRDLQHLREGQVRAGIDEARAGIQLGLALTQLGERRGLYVRFRHPVRHRRGGGGARGACHARDVPFSPRGSLIGSHYSQSTGLARRGMTDVEQPSRMA